MYLMLGITVRRIGCRCGVISVLVRSAAAIGTGIQSSMLRGTVVAPCIIGVIAMLCTSAHKFSAVITVLVVIATKPAIGISSMCTGSGSHVTADRADVAFACIFIYTGLDIGMIVSISSRLYIADNL